jgi:ATP-dependent HslUV protease ATP-binding subunit HslU
LLDDISFTAPDAPEKQVLIDRQYVSERLEDIVKSEDLSHYIL